MFYEWNVQLSIIQSMIILSKPLSIKLIWFNLKYAHIHLKHIKVSKKDDMLQKIGKIHCESEARRFFRGWKIDWQVHVTYKQTVSILTLTSSDKISPQWKNMSNSKYQYRRVVDIS